MIGILRSEKCVKILKLSGEALDFVLEHQIRFMDFDKMVKELQMQINTTEGFISKLEN